MNITVSANAKINLFLDITGKREDGYHNIASVMHSLDLHDSINLTFNREERIIITTGNPYIPTDERNIAYKSAAKFLSELKTTQGISINITKRIPIGGGLGGSSTDGAAVLSGLNYIFRKPFSDEELLKMGASLSADIPFCMKKGAALCEGIGEIMTPLPTFSCCYAAIINPRFSLNTKMMYERYDSEGDNAHPSPEPMMAALKNNSVSDAAKYLYNAFEYPAGTLRPAVLRFKERLLAEGAVGALMSGSGSCVYGLFDNLSDCNALCEKLTFEKIFAIAARVI
ncbi:MAG: 4-(cytidine 5'-diphospho)-2-C-methyl-D-erythritol kinase [Clostridia bacterium]|nr:4-(cytidine 5'-diphospho)-2-C-methyl-D-erythritol kinase [Clostridia bacterium]